jgi:hypothetical protein
MGWKSGLYILGVDAMNSRLLILFLVRLNNSLKSTVFYFRLLFILYICISTSNSKVITVYDILYDIL